MSEKPPLGIKPEWLWHEERASFLIDVLMRYNTSWGFSEHFALLESVTNELARRLKCAKELHNTQDQTL